MIRIKTYRAVEVYFDGKLNDTTDEYLYSEMVNDDNGNLLSENHYDTEGEMNYEYKAEYNDKNQIVSELRIEDGEVIDNSKYTYEGDNLIEERHLYEEGFEERIVNEYDSNGLRIRQISYDTDNEITEKLVYTYDGKNLVNIEYEDEDCKKSPYQQNEYDNAGNVTRVLYTNLEGNVLETDNTYDKKNRLTKTISYNEYKRIDSIEENEYNDKDLIVRTVRKERDRTITFDYKYNEIDRISHFSITDNKGNVLQSADREYENGLIARSVTTTIAPELQRKEIETVRYKYEEI